MTPERLELLRELLTERGKELLPETLDSCAHGEYGAESWIEWARLLEVLTDA